jgi:4-hydroxy-tetrahydrodipicolinate reductase
MGTEVCRAVAGADDMELVAAVDPGTAGTEVGGVAVGASVDAVLDAAPDVVVDFSVAAVAPGNLARVAEAGIHAVVGTTGFTDGDLDMLARSFAGPASGAPNCVLAPNFAIGAVLMARFAELAAPWFAGAEVIELHHDGKLDAPSGTALATVARMAAARDTAGAGPYPPDATSNAVVAGARGGEGAGGIRVHSVRLPGLVAHQEVLLGATGQTLTIRHDTTDRRAFMDGVLLAVRRVPGMPGLTAGLEHLLGI